MALSIGLSVNPQDPQWLELAREAERVGVDSIWVPEFWAYDAFTPLAAIAARTERVRLATGIAQLGARTPAMGSRNASRRCDLGHIPSAPAQSCYVSRRFLRSDGRDAEQQPEEAQPVRLVLGRAGELASNHINRAIPI